MTPQEILNTISDVPVHVQYGRLLLRVASLRRKTIRLTEIEFSLMDETEPITDKNIRLATWLARNT